jgi:hypothetical protein
MPAKPNHSRRIIQMIRTTASRPDRSTREAHASEISERNIRLIPRSSVKRISKGEDPSVGDDGEPVGEAAEVGRRDVGAVGEGQLLVRRAHDLHGRATATPAVPLVVPPRHGRCDSEISLVRDRAGAYAALLAKRKKKTSLCSLRSEEMGSGPDWYSIGLTVQMGLPKYVTSLFLFRGS